MQDFNVREFAHEMCTYTPEPFEAEWEFDKKDHVDVGYKISMHLTRVQKVLNVTIPFEYLGSLKKKQTPESIAAGLFYKQLKKISIVQF